MPYQFHGGGEQLHQPPIQASPQDPGEAEKGASHSHGDSPVVASPELVLGAPDDELNPSSPDSQQGRVIHEGHVGQDRALAQSMVEAGGFQGAWGTHADGWSQKARDLIKEGDLSKSTTRKYQTYLQHLLLWCKQKERPFPFGGTKEDEATMADYLEDRTKSLERPGITIKTIRGAVNGLAAALNLQSPMGDPAIAKLCSTIMERRTTRPVISRAGLDPRIIGDFWRSQPDNAELSHADLRAKALSLLCITKFLCPDDAAKLNRDLMHWNEDHTKCTFREWGFKNDKALQGNAGFIPTHSDLKICPLTTLCDYTLRTCAKEIRIREVLLWEYEQQNVDIPQSNCRLFAPFILVFMDLDRDKGLAAVTCGQILKDVIRHSGADPDIYTTGSFRRGRANTPLAGGMKARYVCDIGKWASKEVFYKHYTSTRVPRDYTEQLLGQGSIQATDKEWAEREDNAEHSGTEEGAEQEGSEQELSEDECSSSSVTLPQNKALQACILFPCHSS